MKDVVFAVALGRRVFRQTPSTTPSSASQEKKPTKMPESDDADCEVRERLFFGSTGESL
jgi:hypothetical protein